MIWEHELKYESDWTNIYVVIFVTCITQLYIVHRFYVVIGSDPTSPTIFNLF
jgi:hypothetical protein